MENESRRRDVDQVTTNVFTNDTLKRVAVDAFQKAAAIAVVAATETLRTAANIAIFGIAKSVELVNNFSQKASEVLFDNPKDTQQRSKFVSKLKDDPGKFLEYTKNIKEKLQESLEKLQQKLVEIKKSISRLSLALNKAKRKYHLLSNRMDALGKELEKVKDKIKELEKQPGQEKNVEILKVREKEILSKLEELNARRLEELNRIKELEEQKKKLEKEKEALEKEKEKCQDKIEKINSLEHEFKQTFNLETKDEKNLVDRYRENISKKYEKIREENPTEVSHGHLDFKAFIDTNTYNMQNLTSTKSSMRQEVEKSWIETESEKAINEASERNARSKNRYDGDRGEFGAI